jgi:hypothetical protein
VEWWLLYARVRVGNGTRTIDTVLNGNLTIVSYDIVMSVIRRIRGMKIIRVGRTGSYLTAFAVFLTATALIAGGVGCDGYGGYDVYDPATTQNLEIRTWSDLDAVRDNLDGNHILMNDLDSTTAGYTRLASQTAHGGKGWEPIDNFRGTFDGQGYEIRELVIDRPREDYAGLFGFVEVPGIVQDIGLVSATVIGANCVGALVGRNNGTVSGSYSTGSVTGDEYVGGLVGQNVVPPSTLPIRGTVDNCYSTGSVTGNRWVGGLAGENLRGTVNNSYSTVSVTGYERVGGLLGINCAGTVSNSYFAGSVTGTSAVAGVVGDNCYGFHYSYGDEDSGTVSNSYYDYDEILINGESIITRGALVHEDFAQWLANDKSLDVNNRLSQEDGYHLINSVVDFKQLLAFGQNSNLKFRLTSDLDLGSEPNFYIPYFAGEFDGNGHKISNLSLNFDFVYTVGLFGYLARGGKVTDLAVENVDIAGDESVGGLVGYNEGIVGSCSSTGGVTGKAFAGGLVGQNFGTVSNSHFTGTVAGDCNVGGLVGHNYGSLSNSYSNGNVDGISSQVGGLVGFNGDLGTVRNSYSTASASSDNNVGGLVGANAGPVSNCYSTGSVTGDHVVGGLVGQSWGTVSNSFWDIETSGQATSDGGIGKTTAQMQDIATFSAVAWNITAVALNQTDVAYIWNIVNDVTYPFLSWE